MTKTNIKNRTEADALLLETINSRKDNDAWLYIHLPDKTDLTLIQFSNNFPEEIITEVLKTYFDHLLYNGDFSFEQINQHIKGLIEKTHRDFVEENE